MLDLEIDQTKIKKKVRYIFKHLYKRFIICGFNGQVNGCKIENRKIPTMYMINVII